MKQDDYIMNIELLHQLFEYKNGELYRRITIKNQKAGSIAGCVRKDGYRLVRVENKLTYVHRIIYWLHYGYFDGVIDHIDMNPLNNRIENLRACKHRENLFNRTKTILNTSGCKNVYWDKKDQRYKVQVTKNKIRYSGGSFKQLKDAKKSATALRLKLHQQFANHG